MAEQPIRATAPGGEPAAVLLDAMGTLLTFAPPAPLLRAALRERAGVDIGEDAAARAIRAEIRFYRAHLHTGRDPGSLGALRRASAAAMRPELAAAAGLDEEALTGALLASLRFEAFPDAAPALRRLRAAGLRLVVVSNWDASLAQRLAETGLLGLLDGVVASAPFGAAKPDPAIFAHALALAGVAPAAAWHVGDSEREDVEGAIAAGVRPVLLDRDGGAVVPDVPVIRSLAELPERLRRGEYPWPSRR